MEKELSVLFGFLGRFGSEVVGREAPLPEGEVAAKLIRFAKGESTQEERAEACEILRQRPIWIRWLADKVKLGRVPKETKDTVAS